MFSKFLIAACVAVACARPDGPQRGFGGYQFEQPQQTYQPQPQQTYQPQASRQSYSEPEPSYGQQEKEEGMPFNFGYEVKDEYSGNDFSHNSDSDGHVTKGEYRVLLPDGRTQIVTYVADHEDGFQAEVTYEGEARSYEAPDSDESYGRSQDQYQPQASFQQSRQAYQQSEERQSYQQPQQSYRQPSNIYTSQF